MTQISHEWRDIIEVSGGYVKKLPNRPGGYIPTLGLTTIRDYPDGNIAEYLRDNDVAKEVAYCFYTKTKLTRDAFVNLLTEKEILTYMSPGGGQAYLAGLAVAKYLGILDGVGWPAIPHRGLPGTTADFQTIWKDCPTRVHDSLLFVRSNASAQPQFAAAMQAENRLYRPTADNSLLLLL